MIQFRNFICFDFHKTCQFPPNFSWGADLDLVDKASTQTWMVPVFQLLSIWVHILQVTLCSPTEYLVTLLPGCSFPRLYNVVHYFFYTDSMLHLRAQNFTYISHKKETRVGLLHIPLEIQQVGGREDSLHMHLQLHDLSTGPCYQRFNHYITGDSPKSEFCFVVVGGYQKLSFLRGIVETTEGKDRFQAEQLSFVNTKMLQRTVMLVSNINICQIDGQLIFIELMQQRGLHELTIFVLWWSDKVGPPT